MRKGPKSKERKRREKSAKQLKKTYKNTFLYKFIMFENSSKKSHLSGFFTELKYLNFRAKKSAQKTKQGQDLARKLKYFIANTFEFSR